MDHPAVWRHAFELEVGDYLVDQDATIIDIKTEMNSGSVLFLLDDGTELKAWLTSRLQTTAPDQRVKLRERIDALRAERDMD